VRHYPAVDAGAVAAESPLPTLHWFVEDTTGALWDNPVQTFVAFDAGDPSGGGGRGLKFYGGGVTVRRRGSGRRDAANMWGKKGTKDWPKRKLKLDFRGRDFAVMWDGSSGARSNVEEVNLHSSYDEPGPESYIREVLAAAAFRRVGVPGRGRPGTVVPPSPRIALSLQRSSDSCLLLSARSLTAVCCFHICFSTAGATTRPERRHLKLKVPPRHCC